MTDADSMITDIDASWAGAVNDAYIFRESIIEEVGSDKWLENYYFLGDSG